MFREIRTSERITEQTRTELDMLYRELFDCRVGSAEARRVLTLIEELEDDNRVMFDPDARI